MTVHDLDTVLPIQRDGAVEGLGTVFPQDRYPFPTEAVRQRWADEIADPGVDCFVVLDPTGEIVGFAATRNDEFLHFGTARRTWGSGIASSAHDAVLAHLRSQGHEQVSLRVFEGNGRGRRFYDKHGWTPTDDRTRSAFAPNPVLLRYTRTLPIRVQRVAAYGLARRGESVLLVRVAGTPRGGGGLWMLPGGGIEHGETPQRAVVRELAEETGYDVVVERLLEVGSDHRTLGDGTDYHGVFALYDVTIVSGNQRDEVSGSTDKVEWIHHSQVGDLTMLGPFQEVLRRWMREAAGE
jgi:8-oxo-dGTP pyrophosphatase MutT (NUDIX family)/RimJ/RimL family protein N-acetyltransferase